MTNYTDLISGGMKVLAETTYTANGTHTWNAKTKEVLVILIGGGGGGGYY